MNSQLPKLTPAEWLRVAETLRAYRPTRRAADSDPAFTGERERFASAIAACLHLAETPVTSEPGEDEREHCEQIAEQWVQSDWVDEDGDASTQGSVSILIRRERAQVRAEYERKLDEMGASHNESLREWRESEVSVRAEYERKLDDLTKAAAEREQRAYERGIAKTVDAIKDVYVPREHLDEIRTALTAERQRADQLEVLTATQRVDCLVLQQKTESLGSRLDAMREQRDKLAAELEEARTRASFWQQKESKLSTTFDERVAEYRALLAQHQELRAAAENISKYWDGDYLCGVKAIRELRAAITKAKQ